MNRHFFLVILFLVMFPGISKTIDYTGEPPGWIYTGEHIDYTDDEYITGIGSHKLTDNLSEDREESAAAAINNVAQQIRSSVRSETKISETEINRNEYEEYTYDSFYYGSVNVETDVELQGVQIVDRYVDEEEEIVYSLAALNKNSFLNSLAHDIKTLEERIESNINRAKTALYDGYISMYMNLIQNSYELSINYSDLISVYNSVSIENFEHYDMISKVLLELEEVLSDINIKLQDGHDQIPVDGRGLSDPIDILIYYAGEDEVKLNNIDVNISIIEGYMIFDDYVATGSDGKASIRVENVMGSETDSYRINANVNLETWKEENEKFSLWNDLLEDYYIYKEISLEYDIGEIDKNIKLIFNDLENYEGSGSDIGEEMRSEMVNIGMSVQAERKKSEHINTEVITQNNESYDYFILSSFGIDYLGSTEIGKSASLNARFTVYSTSNNEIAFEYSTQATGVGEDNRLAAQRAIRDFRSNEIDEFVDELINRIYH